MRALGRARIPRGLAVAVVYLGFAAAVGVALVALATVVVDRTRNASNRVDTYFTEQVGRPPQTEAERDLNLFEHRLDTHGLKRVQIEKQGKNFLHNIGTKDVTKYTSKAISWAEAAGLAAFEVLFGGILVIVVSIYMLLDMPRLGRALDRRFPPRDGGSPLLERLEMAVFAYVKGQLLLSLIIGGSAGLGLYILGATGLRPGARPLRADLRRVGGVHRADPVSRPVARRGAAGDLRALRAPDLGGLGGAALPRDPPDRGPRRGAEGDGHRPAPQPAARDLRTARRARDLRLPRRARGAAAARDPAGDVEYFSAAVELEPWTGGPVPVDVELEKPLETVPPAD